MSHRTDASPHLDLNAVRPLLDGASGPRYWRSLEELAGTEAFQDYLRGEFPENVEVWTDPASRRDFLRLMGASLALAGIGGCGAQPPEEIVPYVKQPESVVPGRPRYYATAMTLGGFATGVLVESHEGRPTRIEGNPDHPASLGAADPFTQAEILALYDPDRSRVVLHNGRVSTYDDFLSALLAVRQSQLARKGAGLRVLTGSITSPTLAGRLKALLDDFPEARWHRHEPAGGDVQVDAPIYDFSKADIILSLDANFLAEGPSHIPDSRAFAARRELAEGDKPSAMNRLYVAEPCPTITGAMADHRKRVKAGEVLRLAQHVADAVGGDPPVVTRTYWADLVADDLKAHRGRGLVLAGAHQPAAVHVLAHQINVELGNVGQTVSYLESAEVRPPKGRGGSLADLVGHMQNGKVAALLILGGNPVYDAPADLDFAGALKHVGFVARLGLHEDETSELCPWHVPEAHTLETWGDALAFDGTATIQQPLIAPLYNGKSAIELLSAFTRGEGRAGLAEVRETWKERSRAKDFDAFWRKALHDGVVAGEKPKPRDVSPKDTAEARPDVGGLEIVFRPDPTIWDGRYANNGWLQELPKPMSKLTWDNAALMSPATAKRLGLAVDDLTGEADVVDLSYRGRTLRMPIWILPGHADDSVTVHLGYGRKKIGRVGENAGASAYALRTSDAPHFGGGLEVVRTGVRQKMAITQHHQNMENRELVRSATAEEFARNPEFAQEPDREFTRDLTLFDEPEPQAIRQAGFGNAWGMAINLNTCIGCNACVTACQSENNIPVVGKEQVLAGRELHWIRIDRYYEGSEADPAIVHQPVPCMHCEKAPCELVCPVAATTHSAEGLNEMTYNRCVGTRYCSNNCPYKVRRFNFLQYSDQKTPVLKLLNNPDVTVRTRGVMEKCTYCVQRISAARIHAEADGGRPVRGNEVVTACQAACPTRAITFGNLNDREAEVVKWKESPRNYALLAELNTRPRTTYLAKLTNPNPKLGSE